MQFVIHSSFDKEYRKLSIKLRYKVDEKLKTFDYNHLDPILDNHQLYGKFSGCRSIDITGDYRAVYYLNEDIAVFIHVGTHHQLYGK